MRQFLVFTGIALLGSSGAALGSHVIQYVANGYVTLPLYGAAIAQAPAQPQPQAQQPALEDRLRRIEERLEQLLQLLQGALSEGQQPQPQAAQANAQLYLRKLDPEEEILVASQVARKKMPPPDNEYGGTLTDEQRRIIVDAYRGRDVDGKALAGAIQAGACAACHSSTVDFKTLGKGFWMLTDKPPQTQQKGGG